MQQQHTIKKFSLELQTQGTEHSYALQRKCIKMVNENLMGGIDAILTDYFPADEIVRINKIEIDLGNITNEELEKDFVAKCMAELTSKIKKISLQQKEDEAGEIVTITKEENVVQQFFYFLATGKISWAAHHTNFQQWQTAVEEIVKKQPAIFKSAFTQLVIEQPQIIERLLLQFNDAFVQTLIVLYQPFVQKEYEHLSRVITNNFLHLQNEAVKKKVWVKLLPAIFNPAIKINEEVVEEIITWISGENLNSSDGKIMLSLTNAVIVFAEKAGITETLAVIEVSAEKQTAPDTIDLAEMKNQKETGANKTDEKSIYINNAGIIILHPFLQNIFKATGLMQVQEFKDEFSKQKAVHLLQYLANGELQAPEYIMPLHKILCGISEEEHIDRFIQLEKTEMNEADELLDAVITHWTTLKNTSAAALQETFFQRSGKLTFNEADGYWKLQVERKAVDILLDKIPWGISYIQLPWMKYALVTEW